MPKSENKELDKNDLSISKSSIGDYLSEDEDDKKNKSKGKKNIEAKVESEKVSENGSDKDDEDVEIGNIKSPISLKFIETPMAI